MKRMNKKVGMSKSSNALKFMSLTAALAFALVAFEWKSYDQENVIYSSFEDDGVAIEPILITYPEKKEVKVVVTQKEIIAEKKLATATMTNDILVVKKKVPFVINLDSLPTVDPWDEPTDEAPIAKPVMHPHEKAVFPGGDQALFEFLGSEIKYPNTAMKVGIEGLVYVQFVVKKDGSIRDVQVKRGIGGGCEEEAVRALLSSPNWTPGKVDGSPVDSYFNLPVRFGLKP